LATLQIQYGYSLICPTQLHFRFPPNLFLAILYTPHVEMRHTNYSKWLYKEKHF